MARQELFHVFEFPGVRGIFGISSLRCGVDRPLSHASLPEKRKRSRPSQCVTLSLCLSLSLSLSFTFKVSFFRHHQHLPPPLQL